MTTQHVDRPQSLVADIVEPAEQAVVAAAIQRINQQPRQEEVVDREAVRRDFLVQSTAVLGVDLRQQGQAVEDVFETRPQRAKALAIQGDFERHAIIEPATSVEDKVLGSLRGEEVADTVAQLQLIRFLGLVELPPAESDFAPRGWLQQDTGPRTVLPVVSRDRVCLLIPPQSEVHHYALRGAPPQL